MKNSRIGVLNYHSNNLLLDNKQAPITPALACNLDNTTAESLLTKFKEYLRIAVFIGCKM